MKKEEAQQLLEETRNSYDRMAEEFSASRAAFWEELLPLADYAKEGMQVLDLGCGNGRFYPVLKKRNIVYTGLDYSRGLLEEARHLHPEGVFIEGDATKLPFPDKSFDAIYSFAVIHHIPSHTLRKKFIEEAARVLRSGGMLILTSWYLWQPAHFGKLALSMNPFSKLERGDLMLIFGKKKHPRYVHAFTERELQKLIEAGGFTISTLQIVARKSGAKNIAVIAKKKN